MKGDESKIDAFDFHTFHQFATEVKSRCRSGNGTLVLGKDTLEIIKVVGSGRTSVNDIAGKRCLTKCIEVAFELVMRTVIQETQCTSSAGCVVDHLSHHRSTLVEEELITDSYLASRFDQNVPKSHFFAEFTEQENFDFGIGLFLCAVKSCREYFRVVEDECVAIVKMLQNMTEVKEDGIAIFVFQRVAFFIGLVHIDTS